MSTVTIFSVLFVGEGDDPVGDEILELIVGDDFFGNHAIADANARGVHAFEGATDERVPGREVSAFGDFSVTACWREPVDFTRDGRCELHAVMHNSKAAGVVAALARLGVQELAGNAGEVKFAGVFVFKLMNAAEAAAVAERLPLVVGHLLQRFGFPEGFTHQSLPVRASRARLRGRVRVPGHRLHSCWQRSSRDRAL